MPRRPPETYHSDLHLSWWRRVLIWLGESPVGRAIIGWPLLILALAPTYWLKWWWPCGILLAGLFFTLGWNAAWRKLKRDGYLNKI